MYEIYSIGDGAYLTAVLNAVAMLSGSGDMQQLAGVGFLMGILLVMGQGILQAKFPPLQNVLFAWVLYMAMFGPTARVQVEDLYSGATRHVDNVPLGVAFVGSAMSKVGYGVTVLFEQAFSTPAMTEYGFAAPLQILQDTRKGTWSSVAQGAANAPTPGADMERSWSAYIAGCVLWNVDTGRVARDTIVRDPSWPSAFDPHGLVVPTVQLWLGGAPVTKDCRAAWADLRDYTTTAYTPALRRSLAATLRIEEGNVDGTIQAALDALAGMGSDAQDYMVMAALLPFWTKGKADVYRELGKYNDAVMVEQAAQQRNTQWAAEERLFSKIVRPMMTFFEAFLFAISPLMMFAIGLGPVGIRMVGKYLMFALWIQLWKPILAVINLYIIMAVQGKLDALQAAGTGDTPLPSLSGAVEAGPDPGGLPRDRRDARSQHTGDQSHADLRLGNHRHAPGRTLAGRRPHQREDRQPRCPPAGARAGHGSAPGPYPVVGQRHPRRPPDLAEHQPRLLHRAVRALGADGASPEHGGVPLGALQRRDQDRRGLLQLGFRGIAGLECQCGDLGGGQVHYRTGGGYPARAWAWREQPGFDCVGLLGGAACGGDRWCSS